jgi:hypothetical protein
MVHLMKSGTVFLVLRLTSVIKNSQRPVATMSARGLVGRLEVKIDFVSKFEIVGLIGVSFLVGRGPLLLEIMKVYVWSRLK